MRRELNYRSHWSWNRDQDRDRGLLPIPILVALDPIGIFSLSVGSASLWRGRLIIP